MNDFMSDITKIVIKNPTINFTKKKKNIVVKVIDDDELLSKVNMFSCSPSQKFGQNILHQISKKRRRSFVIEKTIDLHGFTRNIAFAKLSRFFHECRKNEITCVLVITGGSNLRESVLRQFFLEWMKDTLSLYISSYSEANLKNGGQGAFYVVLKRKK